MALEKYRSKRNFKHTKEPVGKSETKKSTAIFVVQKHQASHLHYDFRLEEGGVLKSWAVPKGLPAVGEKRLAMMVEDHPIEYQHFEGTIPKGNYGAGTVMVWDNGSYKLLNKNSIAEGIEKGEFSFLLNGKKTNGNFSLVKLNKGAENSWLMICREAKNVDASKKDFSIVSGRSMEQIAAGENSIARQKKVQKIQAKPMPEFIKPMLALSKEKSFDNKDWIFEVKWDGYRVIARKEKKQCNLFSRNHKSFDETFFSIAESLKKINGDFILDGEVVATDEQGKSSFQLLQNYLTSRQGILIYYVFDILYLDGQDLVDVSLIERKKILQDFLPQLPNVKLSEFIFEKGNQLFEQVSKLASEGVVAKKATSKYQPGIRSNDWLKIKAQQSQEAIIVGFTEPRGSRKKFGALILARPQNGELKYIGHSGGGFDEKKLSFIEEKLKPLIIEKCPLKEVPKTNMPAKWVKPEIVAEIRFTEITQEGIMRHPIFLGLREDKTPEEIMQQEVNLKPEKKKIYSVENEKGVLKMIDGIELKLTRIEKVFWPKEGYTKEDIINHYFSVAKFILPYLKDRPQSLNRFPNGIEGGNFFHKDVADAPSWIQTEKVYSESENREVRYLLCQKTADLIYMVNLGCIEINPWNSRIGNLDRPDYMVFDIDPLDVPFEWAIKVALELKKILDAINIKGFCKTSGSRGLHVFVPVGARYDYEFIKEFAHLVNMVINVRLPEITSLERKPAKRANKVYLDFLQNRKGQTMAAAYSLRPKAGATVSTPLLWEEVNENLKPATFNIITIEKRLKEKGDLWKAVLGKGANLENALIKLSTMLKDNRIK